MYSKILLAKRLYGIWRILISLNVYHLIWCSLRNDAAAVICRPDSTLSRLNLNFSGIVRKLPKKILSEICLLKTFWSVFYSINLYGKSRPALLYLRQTHMCRPAAGYGFRIKSLNRVIPLLNVVNRLVYLDQQPVAFKVSNKVVNINSAPAMVP